LVINQNNIYIYERRSTNSTGSQRSILTKDALGDEFEILKRKIEKVRQLCQFCKKSPGKFTCDCGCIVCKEHSNLEEIGETTVLDLLGLLLSAMGHDLGHPGLNNGFHINASTELGITYNDKSCLEISIRLIYSEF